MVGVLRGGGWGWDGTSGVVDALVLEIKVDGEESEDIPGAAGSAQGGADIWRFIFGPLDIGVKSCREAHAGRFFSLVLYLTSPDVGAKPVNGAMSWVSKRGNVFF